MKLLFENWRKYLTEENTGDIWYHTTHEITADAVEEEGIYTDHGGFVGGFTLGDHWADEIYEMRPVYLTKESGKSSTRPKTNSWRDWLYQKGTSKHTTSTAGSTSSRYGNVCSLFSTSQRRMVATHPVATLT